MNTPSFRAQMITRRTYNRPLDTEGKTFETWAMTVARVIEHQAWLWERALGRELNLVEASELQQLEELMLSRKVSTSGRTLWLGGTEIAKQREASQFNCSSTMVETVFDLVDIQWLLLQGCGVGFSPVNGQLTGFAKVIPTVEVIHSTRIEKGGNEENEESFDKETGVWTITIGDSAEAWAKGIGKILAGKHAADKLVFDFSQLRPSGQRLSGYGWISSGDEAIARAYKAIAAILNKKAGSLLTKMDILDIVNWMGTILSSRRSAEICLMNYGDPEWREFASAKFEEDPMNPKNPQRQQSNNSLVFNEKPTRDQLEEIFGLMKKAGGSEPAFINAEAATKRAPWFKGVNPCAEILLGNKSFCNLVEIDVGKFYGDHAGLHDAIRLAARANYRQTCVDLRDGVLQEAWHLNNEFLRLCGVGLTGIARRGDLSAYNLRELEREATSAAYSMADELRLPRPKNVTTVKPSGTLSKIMDTTEGVHKPLAKYIFNNVNFGRHDPLIEVLKAANYKVRPNPIDPEGVLVTFPVAWEGVEFTEVDGLEVNLDTAVDQLNKYKMFQENYTQQNTSNTISYDLEEVPEMIDWLMANWDSYVGVSFIYRDNPLKTAEDLGYAYLPQEVVTKELHDTYSATLLPVDLENVDNTLEELREAECSTGVCPTR